MAVGATTVVRSYYAGGKPAETTRVTGAAHVVVNDQGHLILRDGANVTLAVFPPGEWKAFHRDGSVETQEIEIA